jgi:hypothetical protein
VGDCGGLARKLSFVSSERCMFELVLGARLAADLAGVSP